MPDKKLDDQICPICKTYFKTCPHILNEALKEFVSPKCPHLTFDEDYLCGNPEELTSSNCKDDKCPAKTQEPKDSQFVFISPNLLADKISDPVQKAIDTLNSIWWKYWKENYKPLKEKIEQLKLDTKSSFKNFFDGVKSNMVDIQKLEKKVFTNDDSLSNKIEYTKGKIKTNTERILKLELLVAEMNVDVELKNPQFVSLNPHEIMPAVEKGIDFQLSQEDIDIMKITGFIPFRIFFHQIKKIMERKDHYYQKWSKLYGEHEDLKKKFKSEDLEIIYAKESFMDLQKMLEQQKIIIGGKNEEIGKCLNEKSKLRHLVADKDKEIEQLNVDISGFEVKYKRQMEEIEELKKEKDEISKANKINVDFQNKAVLKLNKKLEYYLSDCNGVGIICGPNDIIKQVKKYISGLGKTADEEELIKIGQYLEKKP